MNTDTPPPPPPIEIRKYPNRRYYDSSRSRHLTLEEIRGLIREGRSVRIVDSETSTDITGRVLTQIILELDTPKLEFFPVPLLQEVIRVNDQMMKGYLDRFFRQSTAGFIDFLKQFETPLGAGNLFPSGFMPFTMPWERSTSPDAEATPRSKSPEQRHDAPPSEPAPPAGGPRPDVAGSVDVLNREIKALQSELNRLRRARRPAPPPQPRRRAPSKPAARTKAPARKSGGSRRSRH